MGRRVKDVEIYFAPLCHDTPPVVTAYLWLLRAAQLAFSPPVPSPVSWERQVVDAAYSGRVECVYITCLFLCIQGGPAAALGLIRKLLQTMQKESLKDIKAELGWRENQRPYSGSPYGSLLPTFYRTGVI